MTDTYTVDQIKQAGGVWIVRYPTYTAEKTTITPDELPQVIGRKWGNSNIGFVIDMKGGK